MIEKRENPYVFSLVVPVVKVITGVTKSSTTGEYEIENYFIEADKYCRVYTTPARRRIIFSLTSKSRDLYYYIIYTMNDGYEYVNLSYKKYNEFHKECGADRDASYRGFKESIKELASHNIIDVKDSKAEVYWISPHYFFPGSRVDKYPNNMVVVRTQDKRSNYDKILSMD